jgi:hypothetical protein
MLNFKRVDFDMAVRVVQTTGNPAKDPATNGFDRLVQEMQRRRAELDKLGADKVENRVLHDAFP